MKTIKLTLAQRSAFGTPLAGDTLFGQLCWAFRERFGAKALMDALSGYTSGAPFAVVSDGCPAGYLPRPSVPDAWLNPAGWQEGRNKGGRHAAWVAVDRIELPLIEVIEGAVDLGHQWQTRTVVTQNTINRLTGTTGTGPFAPRQRDLIQPPPGLAFEVYVCFNAGLLSSEVIALLFQDIGAMGYGRDATTGLGKFSVIDVQEHEWTDRVTRHYLALAPSSPEPDSLDARETFYLPVTRFPRHGNVAAISRHPFKKPIMLARTGAVYALRAPAQRLRVMGSGFGGAAQPISASIPTTVHQGYAPVVPLRVEVPV